MGINLFRREEIITQSNIITMSLVLFLVAACGGGSSSNSGCQEWDSGGSKTWDRATRINFGTKNKQHTDVEGLTGDQELAVDAAGNATVIWTQVDEDGYFNVWSNRYTADRGWGAATRIETNTGDASRPQIAVDHNGNVLAQWVQWEGDYLSIWANRYVVGSGWETAKVLENNEGHIFSSQVVLDHDGNAIAVWTQEDGLTHSVWANRFTTDGGWGTASLIETSEGDAQAAQIVLEGNGNAAAIWLQKDDFSNVYSVWTNHYTVGSGWGTPILIEDSEESAAAPQIIFDDRGNAIAIWLQNIGPTDGLDRIWANRYIAGNGWGTAVPIENNDGGSRALQLALDGSGNTIAIWLRNDGSTDRVWSNRYTADRGWDGAAVMGTEGGKVGILRLAVDGGGNAMAAWMQQGDIYVNRYTSGTGWNTAGILIPGLQLTELKADNRGGFLIFWRSRDQFVDHLFSKQFTPTTGWSEEEHFSFVPNYGSTKGRVAVDIGSAGTVFSVWHEHFDWEDADGNCSASSGAGGFSIRANRRL